MSKSYDKIYRNGMKKIMMFLYAYNIIIGFEGLDPENRYAKKMIYYARLNKIKGIILFRRNIYNHGQVKNLIKAFKAVKPDIEVTVDEEGGKVSRLFNLVGPVPTAFKMAHEYSPKKAYKIYRRYAHRLKELGITMVFGPVIDLHSNDSPVIGQLERAYSSNPYKVIHYAKIFIKAFKDEGVKTVVKHYPGHGLALLDTHKAITNVTQTFQQKELIPFKKLSKYTPYVMMSHIIDDKIDSGIPASISKQHFDNAKQNGYTQLITDDLHMGSIQAQFTAPKAIVKALNLGGTIIASNMPKACPGIKFKPDHDLPGRCYLKEVKE